MKAHPEIKAAISVRIFDGERHEDGEFPKGGASPSRRATIAGRRRNFPAFWPSRLAGTDSPHRRPSRKFLCYFALLALHVLSSLSVRAGEMLDAVKGPKARVVIVQDPEATSAFRARAERIRQMVNRGMTNLTGKPTVAAAWQSLVSTQDAVGIKVFS